MIWNASLKMEVSRAVVIKKCRGRKGYYSPTELPQQLIVCRDSRAEAAKAYPLSFRAHGCPPRVRIDLNRNLVYLSEHLKYSICELLDCLTYTEQIKIQYLAVDISNIIKNHQAALDVPRGKNYSYLTQLSDWADSFTNLKERFAVVQAQKVIRDFEKIPKHQLRKEYRSAGSISESYESGVISHYSEFPSAIWISSKSQQLTPLSTGPRWKGPFEYSDSEWNIRYGWAGKMWNQSPQAASPTLK